MITSTSVYVDGQHVKNANKAYLTVEKAMADPDIARVLNGRQIYRQNVFTIGNHQDRYYSTKVEPKYK